MLGDKDDRPRVFRKVRRLGVDYFFSENQELYVIILACVEFLLARGGLFSDSCLLDNLLRDVERCLVCSRRYYQRSRGLQLGLENQAEDSL